MARAESFPPFFIQADLFPKQILLDFRAAFANDFSHAAARPTLLSANVKELYMNKWLPTVLLCGVALLGGCAKDGSFTNPFADEPAPASPHYIGEFSDIPIPNDMSESTGSTFVTFAPSGLKCGTQKFSGRVELVSLMNTMRRNMASNGWTLRSLLRSKESILVFEKADRIVSLVFSDGLIFTDMRIFMSPRLQGDSGNLDMQAYTTPGAPTASAGGSGAGSGSSSKAGAQKLSQ